MSEAKKSASPRRSAAASPHDPSCLKPIHAHALHEFDRLPDSAEVRLPVVAALFGVSTATVWRSSKDGRLPEPTRMGNVTTWNVGRLRRAKAK